MRVLLTGANGHVGANTARELLNRGHEVVAFVRSTSDLRGLDGLDLDYAQGDVTNGESVKSAAEGCDAIVHTAAVYQWWTKDMESIAVTAVEGAKNVLEAAKHVRIQRVVYTSSVVAIGTTTDPETVLTVDHWNDNAHTQYAKAKTHSEREAWKMANAYDIPMIVLCPGTVFGPLDYKITPSTALILGMADGTGQSFDSGLAAVDVRDVARIHAQAVERGETGKRYAIVGKNVTLKQLGETVSKYTGKEVKHFGASPAIGKVVAGIMELGARFTGKPPVLTRALIDDYAGRYQFVDATPTKTEFDWSPIEFEDTVRDTVDWLTGISER